MEGDSCNRYRIKIVDSRFKCIEANGERGRGFAYPDVSEELHKVYVVKHDSEICYVGTTRQDIRNRLRGGFVDTGSHGYHGYKWRGLDTVELLVWCFPDSTAEHVEAIEAELVYLIREKTGKWPKYQMEIHFHAASETQLQDAKSMFHECVEGDNRRNENEH